MKTCPKCKSKYSDLSLLYCLQDGTQLIKSTETEIPTVLCGELNFPVGSENVAVQQVWDELCRLDSFLNSELNNFIQSQTHIEVSSWNFINRPLALLENNRTRIGYELYNFAKNTIFVHTLQRDINDLLNILRRFLVARRNGDEARVKILMVQYDIQLNTISTNYLKVLTEFRNLVK